MNKKDKDTREMMGHKKMMKGKVIVLKIVLVLLISIKIEFVKMIKEFLILQKKYIN